MIRARPEAGDFALDVSEWPVVVVVAPPIFDDARLEAFFPLYERAVFSQRSTFVLVIDGRAGGDVPSARSRQILAAWRKEHGALITTYSAGTAIVSTSVLARGALTAVQWIAPLPIEVTIEPTMAAAMRWARAQLGKRGVSVAQRR